MGFRRFSLPEVQADYWKLYKKAQRLVMPFCGFDFFNKKLFAGDFQVLNRYDKKVYGWYSAGQPKILVTHYLAKEEGHEPKSTLGSILIDPSTAPSEIKSFQLSLREELKEWRGQTVAPQNGHRSLGFALPASHVDSNRIGFQSTSQSLLLQSFFKEGSAFKVSKQFMADIEPLKRDHSDIMKMPRYLTVRSVSQLRFKKDVAIYNQLLNRVMQGEEGFCPLTFDEEWEIMKHSWPLIVPEYFLFLMYNGVEVGFCYALPDYNQVMQNGSDLRNALVATSSKRSITRARIFRAGILSHFADRGWLSLLKKQVAMNMAKNGVSVVENDMSINQEAVEENQLGPQFLLYGF